MIFRDFNCKSLAFTPHYDLTLLVYGMVWKLVYLTIFSGVLYRFISNIIILLDIVCGNMKAIMRLILALAAHFKPRSVRNSVTSVPEPAKTGRRLRRSESSLSAAAAEAAATLHDVSRAAASVGTPYHGSRLR